jgi:hypothetical protein
MGIASGLPLMAIDFNEPWREPTEMEKASWKLECTVRELKRKHEQFLQDREAKERRLLYAIAEKLGIDVENI